MERDLDKKDSFLGRKTTRKGGRRPENMEVLSRDFRVFGSLCCGYPGLLCQGPAGLVSGGLCREIAGATTSLLRR